MGRDIGGVARRVRLVYSGTNPSAAAVVLKKDGTGTTDTVATGEQLIVTDFEIVLESGGVYTLQGGTGVVISKGKIPTTGGGLAQNNIMRRCLKSNELTITASAGGVVDVNGGGEIIKGPTT